MYTGAAAKIKKCSLCNSKDQKGSGIVHKNKYKLLKTNKKLSLVNRQMSFSLGALKAINRKATHPDSCLSSESLKWSRQNWPVMRDFLYYL